MTTSIFENHESPEELVWLYVQDCEYPSPEVEDPIRLKCEGQGYLRDTAKWLNRNKQMYIASFVSNVFLGDFIFTQRDSSDVEQLHRTAEKLFDHD